ncbi:hypothetical protein ACJMK2_041367 [Sinanodonta woodiana]|uniref:Uncharacterized protein n=1 Tax=Sinanodonta woodiana TaxID=1069815 RepID=A0ABD3W3X9_SINWO
MCLLESLAYKFWNSLNLPSWMLKPSDQHTCYCILCRNRKTNAAYHGRPLQLYILPHDWFLFRVNPRVPIGQSLQDILRTWHICYHGTDAGNLMSILRIGLRIPGDTDLYGRRITERIGHYNDYNKPYGFDTKRIFVSPSIKYAGCDAYAHARCYRNWFTGCTYRVKVSLQVRIRPESYYVGGSTIAIQSIDPLYDDDEIEWSTALRNTHVVTGVLVRFERYQCTGHPHGWTCWTF